jgi:D-glycero-D-manno-heptose 1,7-bisphosphate phosphatase
MKSAVFLDRDGVLVEPVVRDGRPYPPASVADLRIFADASAALHLLKALGMPLIVVTNQPDVARGTQKLSVVEAIHSYLCQALPLDDILACFHDDADNCLCRKPKPGLLLEGAARHGADPRRSFMIGDRWRDVAAGKAAGCRTIWIDRSYSERKPDVPDVQTGSLMEAVNWILQEMLANGVQQRRTVS